MTDYLKGLCYDESRIRPQIMEGRHMVYFSTEEVLNAFERLSRNKATGMDHLSDKMLRQHKDAISNKLAYRFTEWASYNWIPDYITNASIFSLSKEDGYGPPQVGKIRTISVTPAIGKLYELALLNKINDKIERYGLISPQQRGFQKGCGTGTNITELLALLQRARNKEEQYR